MHYVCIGNGDHVAIGKSSWSRAIRSELNHGRGVSHLETSAITLSKLKYLFAIDVPASNANLVSVHLVMSALRKLQCSKQTILSFENLKKATPIHPAPSTPSPSKVRVIDPYDFPTDELASPSDRKHISSRYNHSDAHTTAHHEHGAPFISTSLSPQGCFSAPTTSNFLSRSSDLFPDPKPKLPDITHPCTLPNTFSLKRSNPISTSQTNLWTSGAPQQQHTPHLVDSHKEQSTIPINIIPSPDLEPFTVCPVNLSSYMPVKSSRPPTPLLVSRLQLGTPTSTSPSFVPASTPWPPSPPVLNSHPPAPHMSSNRVRPIKPCIMSPLESEPITHPSNMHHSPSDFFYDDPILSSDFGWAPPKPLATKPPQHNEGTPAFTTSFYSPAKTYQFEHSDPALDHQDMEQFDSPHPKTWSPQSNSSQLHNLQSPIKNTSPHIWPTTNQGGHQPQRGQERQHTFNTTRSLSPDYIDMVHSNSPPFTHTNTGPPRSSSSRLHNLISVNHLTPNTWSNSIRGEHEAQRNRGLMHTFKSKGAVSPSKAHPMQPTTCTYPSTRPGARVPGWRPAPVSRPFCPAGSTSGFPTTIPPTTWSELELTSDYGLHLYTPSIPSMLKDHLSHFQPWCTNKIQLDRDGDYRDVQVPTWEGVMKKVKAYMGFVHLHHGVPLQLLGLHWFIDPHVFAKYVGFLMARQVKKGNLTQYVYLARKVAKHWAAMYPDAPSSQLQAMSGMGHFLHAMERQIPRALHNPEPTMQSLPTMPQLHRFVEALVTKAEASMERRENR